MSEQAESMTGDMSASTTTISSQLFRSFRDPEYRVAYADEHLRTVVPLQIRTIREQRGWTQAELGKRCGKAQGWISQLEDPNYARFSLATLRTLARTFDCMLEVRFKSFLVHSEEQDHRVSGDLRVNKYDEDVAGLQEIPAAERARNAAFEKWQEAAVHASRTPRANRSDLRLMDAPRSSTHQLRLDFLRGTGATGATPGPRLVVSNALQNAISFSGPATGNLDGQWQMKQHHDGRTALYDR